MKNLLIAIGVLGLAASASASQPYRFDPDRGDFGPRVGSPCELRGDCPKPTWPCDSHRDRNCSIPEPRIRCQPERWPGSDRFDSGPIGTCLETL